MVALPGQFTGQCGYMFSPKWLRSLPSNPLRQGPLADPETAATPPTGKDAEPVSLGAFKFKSYQPGNGNSFDAVRNDDYWRKDEGLPYLDEVELVVAVDIDGRSNGLRSGQFNIMHTDNGDELAKYQKDKSFNQVTSDAFAETGYIMLNVAEGTNPTYAKLTGKDGTMDPKGQNAASPLLKVECRRALAEAIDLDRVVKERTAGIDKPANGPFPPGSIGYLQDSGYPKYDVKAAQADMDKCLAAIGKPAAEFTYNTTNDPFNVETNQLVISMWKDAFGDKVKTSVTPVEQGQYIGLALVGNFNAFAWRNHGGVDPDQQFVWWYSGLSSPIGQSAINFGRFQDPDIDKALLTQRTQADPAVRKAATEEINRSFGKNVWNLWNWWTTWGIPTNKKVHDVTNLTLPGSSEKIAPLISGHHGIAQIWCDGGKCS
jgi:peptide/nickel transport system substrate-binding protein